MMNSIICKSVSLRTLDSTKISGLIFINYDGYLLFISANTLAYNLCRQTDLQLIDLKRNKKKCTNHLIK